MAAAVGGILKEILARLFASFSRDAGWMLDSAWVLSSFEFIFALLLARLICVNPSVFEPTELDCVGCCSLSLSPRRPTVINGRKSQFEAAVDCVCVCVCVLCTG